MGSPGLRAIVALVIAAAVITMAAAPAAASGRRILYIHDATWVRTAPSFAAPRVVRVSVRTAILGNRAVLPVIARRRDRGGRLWYRVRLARRPNGSTGWVRASAGRVGVTHWRVLIDRSARRAGAFRDGQLRGLFHVVVGRPSTPTPVGSFFITEKLRSNAVSGPWALALSAYSTVFQEFHGGPGQIALHGRIGLPDPVGTASSNGCVRFVNGSIAWLARHVPRGSPVTIVP